VIYSAVFFIADLFDDLFDDSFNKPLNHLLKVLCTADILAIVMMALI